MDLDEYGPKNNVFVFSAHVYLNSSYLLAEKFAEYYEAYMIKGIRWIYTILLFAGSTDIAVYFMFTIHFLPAFLLLDLPIPLPLKTVLQSMLKINE